MTAPAFSIASVATWADMDANAHMGNFAYFNKCVDARMGFFMQHGFPVAEFAKRRIGPVLRSESIEYRLEVGLLEPLTVTLALAGLSEDGSRYRLVNEILKGDGRLAARVQSEGGWMDLAARKLIAPPEDLREVLAAMPQTAEFERLPASVRR
ncbi:MAG TPA: thioesterase family protein [Steroidobacteraceae bacterium]|jgi:acyl-CoA thioester hydrolase|nr:thioesterase family protein [Steroidobacteraceae bacterium]